MTLEDTIRAIIREELATFLEKLKSGDDDSLVTTDQVVNSGRWPSINNRNTLWKYHKEGLDYIKGRPNMYRPSIIDNFLMSKNAIRKIRNSSN